VMGPLTLPYYLAALTCGAAALSRVGPATVHGGPAWPSLAALGVAAALPRASALNLEFSRSAEKERGSPAPYITSVVQARVNESHSHVEGDTRVGQSSASGAEDAGLPGIAGAPPPQSGIAQLLPSRVPLRLHGLPGWCKEDGTEPRTSSLRARGFARLARRNFYEEEVVSQPADPTEWACTRPWAAWFLYAIVIWAVGTMLAFVLASFCYLGRVPKYDEQSQANPEETFSSGHFGCLSDTHTCFMAFLCPAIRWADTVHMAGVLSFWFAFWILSVCYLPSLAFLVLWGLFPLVPIVIARQNLREKLGLPAGNETWVTDCCFACWCSCCLIAQEARVVNEAYAVGHTSMPVSGGRAG